MRGTLVDRPGHAQTLGARARCRARESIAPHGFLQNARRARTFSKKLREGQGGVKRAKVLAS